MSLSARIPQTLKQVRPVLSVDHAEAKRRVLNLYKIWLRQIPYIRIDYIKNNWTEPRLRDVIKENFMRNKDVTDIRAIDLLVVRGQMDFVETAEIWRQQHNAAVFDSTKNTYKKKPASFLERFYEGH
ncbi:unnamed protein product [Rotaria magnacalcarata]|uniref:NADH dehydrogenase [ubiquinone] 1 alpha subcomplex subunit 6 n=1 Tax=Rotaria magnacalcarata TaxID=392030 RepID=A0A816LKX6_9BILA|nr:unnamed protein product [Rotaria magnacalcarata]CAF1665376.1 unnamed protein product [Rotaria magnacalcarata]CAF1958981.1 unnamed protein product [Rotaria magnacalcarata]CAF2068764.1 unnamed protein product [Rotaria magnacalcarata]CAF2088555.1 unnamed protein product [Rotaria magnacalcarata]